MSVEIILSPALQTLAEDVASVKVEGRNLGECLDNLMRKLPQIKTALLDDNQELRKDYMVFINGENAYMEELSRPVKDGDIIHLMTFFVGG